ncbi:hypothetical protein TPHA_0N00640 [Tetrapisispora phaffii CBS 4417]|uniref:ER membrane protein complex subunit 6 n=1 Tax=Tetrapisispora phaffii (strain ATCC 24235 / CBS 4417 / NBRC 1672 / NRRL Y-8282 / UCD 70-5) TaxID=1071381 RepID=G8C117_TETPH|nr:hypothetical protein TPHA_0N00640 [Tetrapisispora phaffii CBS 4417]CCE65845.1 hypothetical protein TPHA_0N00640 [Tetrapisispora phaffii CBS 4417]
MSSDGYSDINFSGNIIKNKKSLLYVQDSTSLVFGLGAGIIQLESLNGFGFFLICYFSVSFLYSTWICQSNPSKYYLNPLYEIYFESLFRELTGYVMAWTFSYAIVG